MIYTYVNKKRTYVRNSNTQLAAKAIVKAAREEGVACWDLFAATGGKSSCTKWRKEKLMGRDRIHFTKDGYREQGTLLYRALMQSYNQMLKIRNTLIHDYDGDVAKRYFKNITEDFFELLQQLRSKAEQWYQVDEADGR